MPHDCRQLQLTQCICYLFVYCFYIHTSTTECKYDHRMSRDVLALMRITIRGVAKAVYEVFMKSVDTFWGPGTPGGCQAGSAPCGVEERGGGGGRFLGITVLWRPHSACNVVEAENPRCGVIFNLHVLLHHGWRYKFHAVTTNKRVPQAERRSLHGQHVKTAGYAPDYNSWWKINLNPNST